MKEFPKTERSRVRRLSKRGRYDPETIYKILDEGFVCHVGFDLEGQPFVIPTLYARIGDEIFIHGSAVSRMLTNLEKGVRLCLTVTLVDGLVLARSAFHHSMNYRSVVIFGTGRAVAAKKDKLAALKAVSDKLVRGRWEDVREPTANELNVTTVIRIGIEEASAKIREGGPVDDEKDYALPVWAGVLPLETRFGEPDADAALDERIELPGYLKKMKK